MAVCAAMPLDLIEAAVQRFLRDPRLRSLPAEQMVRLCSERVAVIEKHFPPSVAAVHAVARPGSDGVLEWWTDQEGQVRPFAALSEPERQALLEQHARHQAQLAGLADTLDVRGMAAQAVLIRSLQGPAEPARLYSVEGRLLMTPPVEARPEPGQPAVPPHRGSVPRWLWLALCGLLVLLLLLAALWWWPPRPPQPAPSVEPAEREPAQTWPAELVFLLDTSAGMAQGPVDGAPARGALAGREIENIVGALPDSTDTRLVHYGKGQCTDAPGQHGPYSAAEREELLSRMQGLQNVGEAALAAGLRAAADAVDGVSRSALIFAFVGSPDSCGQDICTIARAIHQEKPKLRINLVDLSGHKTIDACMAAQTGGEAYAWGRNETSGVDLSKEAARMLMP